MDGTKRKYIHSTLRVLSKDVKEDDIQVFLEYVKSFTEPGEKANADAVIQVSVSANREKYEEVRRNSSMCEALRLLMKDEIEEELKNAREEGEKEGRKRGKKKGKKKVIKRALIIWLR